MPTRPCTEVSGLFEKDVFMLVFVEDLERLISFPRVRELNGRIRISKSGLFLGDHATTSVLAINMDTNP